jgi:surface polysaccharide O-acyltransferase-like enzyme
MKQRLFWADAVRIFAIYLVLVLHTSITISLLSRNIFDGKLVPLAIATTSVPLFVMLSGALLLGKNESYTLFFTKRLTRILMPWLTWSVIYTIFSIFTIHINTFGAIIREFVTRGESFWFLPMITGLYLLAPAIRLFTTRAKQKDVLFVVVLWFIFVSLLPYLRDSLAFPLHIDDGLVRQVVNFSGYFLLGFFLFTIPQKKYTLLVSLSFIVGGLLWTYIGTYMRSLPAGGIFVKDYYAFISPSIVCIAIGLFLGIQTLGTILNKKINPFVKKWTAHISPFVLGVYFIHPFVQLGFVTIFKKENLISFFPPIDSFINGLILFCVSLGVLFMLTRIPYLKRLLV